jgi:type I restriction enzyme, S subunit
MKTPWEEKKIGSVLQLEYGKPLDGLDRKLNGLYPIYGANGEKDRTDKFYFDKPSIIIGRKGSAGELTLTEPKFWPLDVTYFVTFDERQYDLQFLYHLLTTLDLPRFAKGVKPGINRNEVYSQVVKVPPLLEQKRIIGILDEAFEDIATAKVNAEKNFQNARGLFESHLNDVFTQCGEGWVNRKLGDLSTINYGYTESACHEPVGPKFLRITDIQNNHVAWDTVPYCAIAFPDVLKYQLAEGDIVFARTGATTGKSYLVTEPPYAVFASYLIRVKLSAKEILPSFLFLFFQTRSYWKSIKSGSSGSAQGGFNATKLSELVISYPKLMKEQQTIVEKFQALSANTRRLETIYRQKLAVLDSLKKSLLHQAFSGDL